MMTRNITALLYLVLGLALIGSSVLAGKTPSPPSAESPRNITTSFQAAAAWEPTLVADDPLLRMPGTQPGQVSLEGPNRCLNCHSGYDQPVEPGFNWKGSMMAQAGRDFLFWSCLTVAGQDSIWTIGSPNAVDICERCHFPKGWLEERSDPPNASAMAGDDFDGVFCDFCHRLVDPFYETTYQGTREGNDWLNYWDETNLSDTQSSVFAAETVGEDQLLSSGFTLFNGDPFFISNQPFTSTYTENGGGQYFVSPDSQKRAPFADADPRSHTILYSRYHKSRFFCQTCHDVSNPVLANLGQDGSQPLTTENYPAYSYYHVERTFSEFMLSDFGAQGGAAGTGSFAPEVFDTSKSNNYISSCQDCHMRDVVGQGCDKDVLTRPTESIEHPQSGLPMHDMTGGNAWVSYVLASTDSSSPNYDAVNDTLLNQGPELLTLDLAAGQGVDAEALLAGVDRTKTQLQAAASITNLEYNSLTGLLSFRVENHTGHKLISGFPEGRRMFVNIQVYKSGVLDFEMNPYDAAAGTLKGLNYTYAPDPNGVLPSPAPLDPVNEAYVDELVYEVHPSSSLTGEDKTFHFALATGRTKDNRIPPQGFRIDEAAGRLVDPVWMGVSDPTYFSADEYAGGYDAVSVSIPTGADYVAINLYYQTTSREYIEFLRDEINGDASTLPPIAYIIQSDSFFAGLRAWGMTIWNLWSHNMNVAGAQPFLMTQAIYEGHPPTDTPTPTPTSTATPTPTPTNTPTPTPTSTPTSTSTGTLSPTPTSTALPPTPTDTNTPTPIITLTSTPGPPPTKTPWSTPTNTASPTQTPTVTQTPDASATQTPTSTSTPEDVNIFLPMVSNRFQSLASENRSTDATVWTWLVNQLTQLFDQLFRQ